MPDRELIEACKEDPLNAERWQALLRNEVEQGEAKRCKALGFVIDGLNKIWQRGNARELLDSKQKKLYYQLADTNLHAKIFKDIATMLLKELRLPEVAEKHFMVAKELGLFEDVESLVQQAREQQDSAKSSMHTAILDSVETDKFARPKAASMIRRTGKVIVKDVMEEVEAKEREAKQERRRTSSLPKDLDAITDIEEAMTAVELLVENKRPEEAQAYCLKLEKTTPEHAWKAWTAYGVALQHDGDREGAEKAITQATRLASGEATSWFNLGYIHQKAANYDDARRCYLTATALIQGHPFIWSNLGVVEFIEDNFEEAADHFRRAILFDNKYWRAWDNLGAALGALDRLGEAEVALLKALQANPETRQPWFRLGFIYFDLDRMEEAREAFDKALETGLFPEYCLYYLAMISAREGKVVEAKAFYERAQKIDADSDLANMTWFEISLAESGGESA